MVGPPTALPTTTELVTELETVKVSSSSQSQTLAAMAGIQLTGADMESRRDMSGAMPTATVEEIDVPVFIDGEYCVCVCVSNSYQHSLIILLKRKPLTKPKCQSRNQLEIESQIAGIELTPIGIGRSSAYDIEVHYHDDDEEEDHSAMTH